MTNVKNVVLVALLSLCLPVLSQAASLASEVEAALKGQLMSVQSGEDGSFQFQSISCKGNNGGRITLTVSAEAKGDVQRNYTLKRLLDRVADLANEILSETTDLSANPVGKVVIQDTSLAAITKFLLLEGEPSIPKVPDAYKGAWIQSIRNGFNEPGLEMTNLTYEEDFSLLVTMSVVENSSPKNLKDLKTSIKNFAWKISKEWAKTDKYMPERPHIYRVVIDFQNAAQVDLHFNINK